MSKFKDLLSRSRAAFLSGKTRNIEFRKNQLKALITFLDDNEGALVAALNKDLRKPSFETSICEVDFVRNDARGAIYNIEEYAKRRAVPKNIVTIADDAFIQYEPYGVVLIIGAWNYPIQVVLSPLVGAIAAGNVVILKPSEIAPATAQLFNDLLPKYLDNECYRVVLGDANDTQELLKEKFDYIFYTGSGRVGQLIHEAAARHLTPVTLELGGKSPLYIDDSVPNLEIAWRRILWGKVMNAGQTCVAPDYILCTPSMQSSLIDYAKKILIEFFGENPKQSTDFARIVNKNHFERLQRLLSSGKAVIGGEVDADDLYVAPTILVDVEHDSPIMKEEIFGPIMPIITVSGVNDAIEFINRRDKPLSLYIFSNRKDVINKLLNETSSGSVCANDALIHLTIDELPFGGVGSSGIGRYHGKYSFETFSHAKSVLVRGFNPILEWIASKRYPPYSEGRRKRLARLLKKRKSYLPNNLGVYVTFALGFVACLAYKELARYLDCH